MLYNFDKFFDRSGTDAEKLLLRKKLYGTEDVVPLWVADMDLPSPPIIIDALMTRLGHPLLGYTGVGEKVLKSVIWWMKEQHNLDVESKEILFSPSVVASISAAVDAFTDESSGVVIMSPVYGPFYSFPKKYDRQVYDTPLIVKDGRHHINWEQLELVFKEKKVGLLIFCNPHNPGGRVWNRKEVNRLVNLCLQYDVMIFSDEIHSDLVFPGVEHTPVLSIDGANKITILAHSIGKTFNCSGLNGSFTVIQSRRVRTAFQRSLQKFHTDEINLMAKVAIEAGFSPDGQEYVSQLMDYIQETTKQVCERINGSDVPITAMVPESTFLIWLDFSATELTHEEILKKLVSEAKVGLTGGRFFGCEGERWFRINVAHPRNDLLEIVDRMCKVFE